MKWHSVLSVSAGIKGLGCYQWCWQIMPSNCCHLFSKICKWRHCTRYAGSTDIVLRHSAFSTDHTLNSPANFPLFQFNLNSVLQGWESDGPPAVLDVMAQSTSIQRIQRLIDSVPLTNLLLTLLSTSYRKVGVGTELENFWSWATPDCHHLTNWGAVLRAYNSSSKSHQPGPFLFLFPEM